MEYQIILRATAKDTTVTDTDITNNVNNGFSIVEKLNEELDIGSMEIAFSDRSTPYSMFDTIRILIDDELIYSMAIGGDTVQLVSKNPLIYSHSLSLVEHTKKLERVIISGKTFTQPTDGTTPSSLYDVVNILRITQPLEVSDMLDETRVFSIPSALELYLDEIESPEFTFKDITLREALNQVFSVLNGVARLDEDDNLQIDFYNELQDLIDDETGNYNKTTQQDIEFYATDMTVDALNLVADTDINESVEVYPSENAWVTSRSEQYVYDFTKSYIPTPKRIYQIPKLQIKGVGSTVYGGGDVYDTSIKYQFYSAKADFPTVGDTTISTITVKYYDISTDKMYFYDESISDYTEITIFTPPSTIHPKISFYPTYSDFPTTDTRDICIARDTGIAYRFNTTFIVLNHIDSDGSILIELTQNDRIVEKNIYSTLDSDSSDREDPTTYYKSNTLYYTYRENNIPIGATYGIFDTNTSLEYILKIKFFELLQDDGIIDSSAIYTDASTTLINTIDDNETMFRVHYVPIPKSTRFNIDRQDLTDIYKKTTITTNQQSRIVNTNNFLNNIQAKINKIGNSELKMSNRVTNIGDVYSVNDYTSENYVVTNKEVIFYKDFMDCNYELSRNWNMLSQFIGVNSEIRQWEMGEQDTLKRNLLYKEFIEVSIVASGSGFEDSYWVQEDGVKCLLDTFKPTSTYKPVRNAILDSGTPSDVVVGMSSIGGGNNLLFHFQFDSNINAGNYLEEISSQTANQFARYAETTGKLSSGTFYLYDEFEEENRYEILKERADLFPKTNKSYIETLFLKNDSLLEINKDNREELGLTLQLQFINMDIQDVGIGRVLASRNRLVNENPPTDIKLYLYTDRYFNKNEVRERPSGSTGELTPTLTIDYTNSKVTVEHANLTKDIKSWCLTDENDNIIVWKNQYDLLENVIIFNFNNKRTYVLKYLLDAYINMNATIDMEYMQTLNYFFDTNISTTVNVDLEYIQALNYFFDANISTIATVDMEYIQALNYFFDSNTSVNVGIDLIHEAYLNYRLNANIPISANVEMGYTYDPIITYTVNFYDWDSTLLSSQTIIEGNNATAPSDPTRPDTDQYDYTFDGWSGTYTNVTSDRDITATYSRVLNTYDVIFRNWNGAELQTTNAGYGSYVTPPTDPTREQTDEFTYEFDGWDSTDYTYITGTTYITATYEATVRQYTVDFYSNGFQYSTKQVDYNTYATAPLIDPTKASDSLYDYTFDYWDGITSKILDDTTITAVYTSAYRTDVSWQDTTSTTQSGDNTCDNSLDIANVKVESEFVCVYSGGAAYSSQTSLTTIAPPCSIGATYTTCTKISTNPLLFSCIDYTGANELQDVYYECKFSTEE